MLFIRKIFPSIDHHAESLTVQENGIMCILCTPRPICRSICRPIYWLSVVRHIDRYWTDMSVDMSTNTQLIYRSSCVGQHVDRHINRYLVRHSTDMSLDIYRPTVVVRQSANMLIDRLPTFHQYLYCYLRTGDCSLSHRHNLTLVSDFCWAAQISLIYPHFSEASLPLSSYLSFFPPFFFFRIFCIWQYFT